SSMFGTNSTSNLYENMVEVCISSAMPQIRNMSSDQLNELLYSDEKLDTIINALPQVRSLPSEKETDLAQNKSLAEWNLSQQPRLEQLKKQVKEKYDRVNELAQGLTSSQSQFAEVSSGRSLEVTTNLMQVAMTEMDEEADELATQFKDREIDYIAFCKPFLSKKNLAHKRKVKADRLTDMLQREEQPNRLDAYTRPISMPSGVPNATPYPDISRHSFW
ncbi:hypothetical protein PFISCL1PPCAC_1327, partial [Pristionchus fissidentatus]